MRNFNEAETEGVGPVLARAHARWRRCALMLAVVALSSLFALGARAATRYVAKAGSDAQNSCTNASAPCATITHGIATMAGGDMLIVGDGVYAEQITRMPSGSAAAYTTIAAANDWGVTIDASGFANNYLDAIRIGYVSFVSVRGFHVKMNQANDRNLGINVYSASHVKIQRCSVAYAGTFGNVASISVGPGADYALVEESYAYGGSRYPFLVYQSTHTVVRRCVSRLDYWNGSLQAANFTNYNGDMTVWQNNIAIDSDNANIGGSGLFGGFFNENKLPDSSWSGTATRETYRGNIVLNVQAKYSGMYDYDVSNLHTYSDNVIWDSHGGYYGDYMHGDAPVLDANRFTIGSIRGTYDSRNGQGAAGTGFFIGPGAGGTVVSNSVQNSIFLGNASYGLADYAKGDYNFLFNNGRGNYGGSYATPVPGAHDRTADYTASLMYLPRVEIGSPLAAAGSGGSAVGANVERMWGATGTLWGDPGYDSVTSTNLWPFPNEGVIRADMASYVGPGAPGARGFAAGTSRDGSPQTLTKYIWEYLGNQIPPSVYAGSGNAGTGGTSGTGGTTGSGGAMGSGGMAASGGTTGSGGTAASGGVTGAGGVSGSGGVTGTGGTRVRRGTGGVSGTGGTGGRR